jgi:hypothetical protein
MDLNVEQEEDSPGTVASSLTTTDEKMKDTKDRLMEAEESIAYSTEAMDAVDEETDDVLDLKKLYPLLEQSNRVGDRIAGPNVMLLIGISGAGKVSVSFGLCCIHTGSILTLSRALFHCTSDDNHAVPSRCEN